MLLLVAMSSMIVACSKEGAADAVVESLLGMAEGAVTDYNEEVNAATAAEVPGLKEDSTKLLESLDDVDQALNDAGSDLSDDVKTMVSDKVADLRQQIQDDVTKLDSVQ